MLFSLPVRSTHLRHRSRRLHLEGDEQIVPCPPAPHPFPVDPNRDSKEAQEGGSSGKDVHDFRRTLGGDPWVGKVGEAVKHEILSSCESALEIVSE